jgi:hypothetical protein
MDQGGERADAGGGPLPAAVPQCVCSVYEDAEDGGLSWIYDYTCPVAFAAHRLWDTWIQFAYESKRGWAMSGGVFVRLDFNRVCSFSLYRGSF